MSLCSLMIKQSGIFVAGIRVGYSHLWEQILFHQWNSEVNGLGECHHDAPSMEVSI